MAGGLDVKSGVNLLLEVTAVADVGVGSRVGILDPGDGPALVASLTEIFGSGMRVVFNSCDDETDLLGGW